MSADVVGGVLRYGCCAVQGEGRGRERGEWGEGRKLGRAGGLSNLKPRRREGRTWGSGFRLGGSFSAVITERGKERLLEEGEGPDGWALPGRERRGKEGWGAGGPIWAKQAEKGEGGRNGFF